MAMFKKLLAQGAIVALVAAGATALSTGAASARVVCNAEGECGHVRSNYNFQPTFGLTVHENGWRWGRHDHYRWREHHGRGYWHNGAWITF